MTRVPSRYRPAGLALGLIALSAMGGCAHFHNAEVRAEQARAVPVAAAAAPLPIMAPPPAPVAAPAPPAPAPEVAADVIPTPVVPEASPDVHAPPLPAAPALTALPVARSDSAAAAPASDDAVIIFASMAGAACGNCATLKISVAPSGQVLVEHGDWAGGNRNWRYKRMVVHVAPARASAFAASLRGDRPTGKRVRTDSTRCLGAATEADGLVIEWVEAERHDMLTFVFGCPDGRHGPLAERLRHAPDLLGLHGLVWPGASGQP